MMTTVSQGKDVDICRFMRSPAAAAAFTETSSRLRGTADYSHSSLDMGTNTIILASRSPRRRQLLTEFGFGGHDAVHPGFEDAGLKTTTTNPAAWVAALAYLKAWARAGDEASRGRVVIGADTACLMDGRLIGTPTTVGEADAMIRGFMGREHEVLTGVAVIDVREQSTRDSGAMYPNRVMFTDTAHVRLGVLSESQIAGYLAGGGWQGKAGGYNYREAVEAGWPISHTGDVTTIMGLPMQRLVRVLTAMGVAGGMLPAEVEERALA